MAFQQPQRQPAARPVSFPSPVPPAVATALPQSAEPDQQEWVLFSPAAARTHTTSTERTRTAGRSRLSDFGSLDTAARSDQVVDAAPAQDDNETEDLDSLDDGLHAFNEAPSPSQQQRLFERSGETILPNHDGLGTFPGDSSPVQDRFWQFERYNPRRTRYTRRRSSLSRRVDAAELDDVGKIEDERFHRIEQWRMDQSRALLEEVEKETRRRRRQSRLGSVKNSRSQSRGSIDVPIPADPTPTLTEQPRPAPTESFWQRLTRRVIRDLMGFDEATLSILFGESLAPATSQSAPAVLSPIARATQTANREQDVQVRNTDSWEGRLLERIAKELGVLVHQLSEHPGAFSTYLRTQESFDYAGLPTPATFSTPTSNSRPNISSPHPYTATGPHFRPTLPRQHRHSLATADASLWGIEEEEEPVSAAEDAQLQKEREYWEKDLDVKMVFGYLRNRFSPTDTGARATTPTPMTTQRTPNVTPASTTSPESLRRAALIRHHHPLVSSARRNSIMQQVQNRPPPSPILGRRMSEAASSCASQSSKRSKTGHSGSSRNYWDIGAGSVGSIGWGEV